MKLKSIIVLALAGAISISAAACKPSEPAVPVSTISADNIEKPQNSGEKMQLNVLNWGDYMDEEVLAEFRAEYPNIEVNYETMTSNEEMLVMLQNETSIVDLCFPSDYTIQKLLSYNLLDELDKSKLPHLNNIDPRFMNLEFDPENKYSIPYMWGTVGILYNTKMVNEPVDSWSILWDEKYKGKIFMYDSVRDSMAVALKRLGYSINTLNPDEIINAEKTLIEQKPLVLAYGTDNLRDKMITGGGALAVVYAGDAIASIEENSDLAYVIPSEGSNIWFDNVVMLKNGKNKEAAYLFLDFLLRSDIAMKNTQYIGYSTPNKAAFERLEQSWKDNPVYNPSQEQIDNCEMFLDLGEAINLYNDAWLRIKAAK